MVIISNTHSIVNIISQECLLRTIKSIKMWCCNEVSLVFLYSLRVMFTKETRIDCLSFDSVLLVHNNFSSVSGQLLNGTDNVLVFQVYSKGRPLKDPLKDK